MYNHLYDYLILLKLKTKYMVILLELLLVLWYYLLIWQGIPTTLKAVTRVTCTGFFFNSFMPGSIGGDMVKAFYIAKDKKN